MHQLFCDGVAIRCFSRTTLWLIILVRISLHVRGYSRGIVNHSAITMQSFHRGFRQNYSIRCKPALTDAQVPHSDVGAVSARSGGSVQWHSNHPSGPASESSEHRFWISSKLLSRQMFVFKRRIILASVFWTSIEESTRVIRSFARVTQRLTRNDWRHCSPSRTTATRCIRTRASLMACPLNTCNSTREVLFWHVHCVFVQCYTYIEGIWTSIFKSVRALFKQHICLLREI